MSSSDGGVQMCGEIARVALRILVACLCPIIFSVRVSLGEPNSLELTSSQLILPQLTDAELAVLLDSIRSIAPFAPLQPENEPKVDLEIPPMWFGSRITTTSEVESVVLRFTPKPDALLDVGKSSDKPVAALLESFEVQLSLTGRRFELRHGAADRASGGGFSMSIDQENVERAPFVGGEQGAGLYAAVPLMADSGQGWGALVCPRAVLKVRRDRSTVPALGHSVYELSEAMAVVSMRAEAKVSTAGALGRARISAAVTGALPAPNPDFDQAASALPEVDLSYSPKGKTPFFSLLGLAGRQEGVRMVVEMQNAAGYVRRQYFLQVVAIQRVAESGLARVLVDNRQVVSDEGECYAVVVRRNRWSHYGREKPLF